MIRLLFSRTKRTKKKIVTIISVVHELCAIFLVFLSRDAQYIGTLLVICRYYSFFLNKCIGFCQYWIFNSACSVPLLLHLVLMPKFTLK